MSYNRNTETAVGRTIREVEMSDGIIRLWFDDGTIEIGSAGDCCTHTYFTDLEVCPLPASITEWQDKAGDYDGDDDDDFVEAHDIEFVTITTDRGRIDFTLHAEHNGYYGGWYYLDEKPLPDCAECKAPLRYVERNVCCASCGGMFDAQPPRGTTADTPLPILG